MKNFYNNACTIAVLLTFTLSAAGAEKSMKQNRNDFVANVSDFPREEKNRRKWDAPVVADLDQNGWPDLLINDHGYSVQVMWNKGGRFEEPWDLFMGDQHGVSVGDFDGDGLMEIVISRGGGSGSNARNAMLFSVHRDREIVRLKEFNSPLEQMRGRTVMFFDGDRDGDLDLINFAFPSSEKKGESENYLYENDGQGQLILESRLPAVQRDGQKTLITDFNSDGVVDLLLFGDGHLRAFEGQGEFQFKEVSDVLFPHKINLVTGIVEFDYDNDGDFDLFLSRGEGFGNLENFYDSASQTWGFHAKRGPFQLPDLQLDDTLEIENYQSPWPNMQINVGESAYSYEFKGETHSGRDVHLVSSDALGWPDAINKKGLSVGYVGNDNWRVAGDTFSPMSAVIHGVRGQTDIKPAPGPGDILLENQAGRLVDVTRKSGINSPAHSAGVVAADFDNNGFTDLLVVPRGHLVTPIKAGLWLNQGSGRFEEYTTHSIVSPELGAIGLAVAQLDYNLDGRVDVVLGHERGKWHLFNNQLTPAGNHIIVDLGEAEKSAPTTLGALVRVEACGNSQVQRMGSTSGAAYSRSANRYVHFGLGQCEQVDQVSVILTDSTQRSLDKQPVNKIIRVR